MASRWVSASLSITIIIMAATTLARLWHVAPVQRDETVSLEQWVYLSDLDWTRATTGWLAYASPGVPARDRSFQGRPLTLGGELYSKGLSTYPVSEIVYALDGNYTRFESVVGLDDEVPAGSGGVEFFVFVDEAQVYRSGIVRGGDRSRRVSEAVAGAQSLRLVVSDESDAAVINSADWADARLVKSIAGEGSSETASVGPSTRPDAGRANATIEHDIASFGAMAASDIAYWEVRSVARAGEVSRGYNAETNELYLSNGKIAVVIGYGGPNHGTFTVYHLPSRRYAAYRIAPSLKLANGSEIRLARDTTAVESGYEFSSIDDESLGQGELVQARFRGPAGTITQRASIFEGAPYLILQMSVAGLPTEDGQVRFRLLDMEPGGLVLGDGVEYHTDYSRPRHGLVPDDGIVRKEAVGLGNPVFIQSKDHAQAVLMAALDETKSPTTLSVVRKPGTALTSTRLDSAEMSGGSGSARVSSRLYLEVTDTDDPRTAFDSFKVMMGKIAAPPPLPSWLKYQWLSWYVYYMDVNEDAIRRQIDYIAENLADLGTWSILVDAGWYVAEGREGAGWRNVDKAKFPSGLRALVDYAHSRGQKVVLYFSTPYLDSRIRPGDWLGLGTLIRDHPEWLIALGRDEERKSFVLDYSNPNVREYIRGVLRDFFVTYDVDGIKIDGLGNADGAVLDSDRLDSFGLVDKVAGQTLEIYRFIYDTAATLKNDVYVESGWMTPLLANRYAHTFRYGDEYPSFSNPYPFPGLVEHVDYAVWQKMALGQRPNMGAIYGDPNASSVNLWWLQAGVALGTQNVLSFDLPSMTLEALSQYRSILALYNAFEGNTFYDRSLNPSYFATTVGPMTYLGVLGRGQEDQPLRVALRDIGLDEGEDVIAYDVTRSRFFKPRGRVRTESTADGFRFYVLRSAPGVVWSNSSLQAESLNPTSFEVEVRGPKSIGGFAHIYFPKPLEVSIDGRPLALSPIAIADENQYAYDKRTGIVTLKYAHDQPHRIRIVR